MRVFSLARLGGSWLMLKIGMTLAEELRAVPVFADLAAEDLDWHDVHSHKFAKTNPLDAAIPRLLSFRRDDDAKH